MVFSEGLVKLLVDVDVHSYVVPCGVRCFGLSLFDLDFNKGEF